MLNKNVLIMFILLLFSLGCLQKTEDLENAQYQLIQEKLTSLKNQGCSCFVCTQSSGGLISDIFTYNDLASGGCYIKENCNPYFLAGFSEHDNLNFLRTFDIGMGNTFFEYEEANLRSSIGLGLVLRELKEYELPESKSYILPYYEGDTEKVHTSFFGDMSAFYDKGKLPFMRALEKNTIPIYYINSNHLTTQWLDNFFTQTEIANTPSFIAVKSSSENVNDLVKNINTKCKDDGETITLEGKCRETIKVDKEFCNRGDCVTHKVDECIEYETVTLMQYGCKSMLYIDEIVNASNVNYTTLFKKLDVIDKEEMSKINSFLIHVNITEQEMCHASMATVQAMNLSRTLLNKYDGKPSYLIVSIDEKCREKNENQIAQSLYSSVYYMRMTGIMGMIYYDYLPDSSKISNDVEQPKTFLQLNNYYYNFSFGYNREPLLFDGDGVNISNACDTRSQRKTLSINMSEITEIKLNRLNPNPSELDALDDEGKTAWYYIYALPMLDYGKWEKIRSWSEVGEDVVESVTDVFTDTFGTECDYTTSNYRDVHLDAERCGVSNYLLIAYKKNGIKFDCDKWYNMIDYFVKEGKISVDKVQKLDIQTVRQLAFAYAMQQPDILTESQMRTYCYGTTTSTQGLVSNVPCYVLNDYVDIRADFLEYEYYPTCYSYRIGID